MPPFRLWKGILFRKVIHSLYFTVDAQCTKFLTMRIPLIFAVACFVAGASAQTFQRLGGCPDLGCVFPPDQYGSQSSNERAIKGLIRFLLVLGQSSFPVNTLISA